MALDLLAPVRLGLRIGIGVLRFELRVLEQLTGLDRDRDAAVPAVRVPIRDVPGPEPAPQPQRAAEPVIPPTERVPAPEPDEPAHIDTEAELVAEFSEPGAEEGAGAEIHVEEPWAGYRQMAAADIRERVLLAGPEELAVVQLYETSHRRRRTVLDAVERRSRELANAPSAR